MVALWLATLGWASPSSGVAPASSGVAPVRVALPATEDPATWAHPLALAGLDPGDPGGGAGARIVVEGAVWTVDVVDGNGGVHRLTATAPTDRAGREALSSLIGSMARAVPTPALTLPPLPPIPPAPKPRPRGPEPAPVARVEVLPVQEMVPAEVVAAPIAPIRLGPPAPLVELDDPPPVVHLGWWAGAGPAMRLRSRVRLAGSAEVWAGALWDSRWRLGVGVGGALPGAWTTGVDGPHQVEMVDLRVLAGWSPGPLDVAATLGESVRWVEGADAPSGQGPPLFAVLGATAGWRVPVGKVSVRPGLLVERDLRAVRIGSADGSARDQLPKLSAEVTLSVWTR